MSARGAIAPGAGAPRPAGPCAVLIAGGGPDPRLCELDVHTGQVISALAMSPWGAPTAVAFGAGGGGWAYGTHAGTVAVEREGGYAAAGGAPAGGRVALHDPVLSLCFAGAGELVASTHSGRLSVIQLHSGGLELRDVIPAGRQFSSLCAIGDERVAGLTPEGDLAVYEPPYQSPVQISPGPSPESPWTFARLQYWPAAGLLVYPAVFGALAFHDIALGVTRVVRAHRGRAIAALLHEGQLFTFGAEDRRCHVWDPGDGSPARSYAIPRGIQSVTALVDAGIKLVLINLQGEAGVYRAEGERLARTADVPGRDYWFAAGPPPEALAAARAGWVSGQIELQSAHLVEACRANVGGEVARLHAELSALGAEAESLHLQAGCAEGAGRTIDALRLRLWLASAVPDNVRYLPQLAAAAELLERLFLLEGAAGVWARINRIAADPVHAARLRKVEQQLAAREAGFSILDYPQCDVGLLLDAADALSFPFSGRLLIKHLEIRDRLDPGATPAEFVEKCRARIRARELDRQVKVRGESVQWIHPGGATCEPAAVFCHTDGLEEVVLVVCVDTQSVATLLAPHIVWAAPPYRAGSDVGAHQELVRERYRKFLECSRSVNVWVESMVQVVCEAALRLNNEKYVASD